MAWAVSQIVEPAVGVTVGAVVDCAGDGCFGCPGICVSLVVLSLGGASGFAAVVATARIRDVVLWPPASGTMRAANPFRGFAVG